MGSAPDVELRKLAFSDRSGTTELYLNAPGAKVASLHKGHWGQGENSETVELTTLDNFCEQQGIQKLDLLKLDVEGHELSVLEGAERMLAAGRIEVIQFEFSVANLASRTYLRDFFDCLGPSFHLHRVLRDGLGPADPYHPRHEVFTGATNYLAIRRDSPGSRGS